MKYQAATNCALDAAILVTLAARRSRTTEVLVGVPWRGRVWHFDDGFAVWVQLLVFVPVVEARRSTLSMKVSAACFSARINEWCSTST